jgi:choline dehydrogenase
MKNISRRNFIFNSLKVAAAAVVSASLGYSEKAIAAISASETYDFIIVGSGAGGGPLAARLVGAGYKVLILEAGTVKKSLDYSVPAFSLLASENPAMNWNFFPKHYTKLENHGMRFVKKEQGMLYPRASTVGGCTTHHVMLMLPPQASDWKSMEKLLDDTSWNPVHMKKYFERVLEWLPIEFASPTLLKDDSSVQRVVAAAVTEST